MSTPTERRLLASRAALLRHARGTGPETTRAAREAQMARWERQVDPDGTLPPAERQIRAKRLQRAHMQAIRLGGLH